MSAWELDPRPVQPCVVCGGVPDRSVELPALPDVHRVFGSSALCDTCAAASPDELAARARRAWTDTAEDSEDVVADVVRTVTAALDRPVPPKPEPPDEFRRREHAPLSPEDTAVWETLETLLYEGPRHEVVVSGRIEYVAAPGSEPIVTRVYRAGRRIRLAGADGEPWLVADGTTIWRRVGEAMVAGPDDGHEPWAGRGTDLIRRRPPFEVDVFGFIQPLGPIVAVQRNGRDGWRFAFAAPRGKPFDMQVVVDAETGFLLERWFGDAGDAARWLDITVGGDVDDALFRWDGPTRTAAEVAAAAHAAEQTDLERRARWFAEHVTASRLTVAGRDVDPLVHTWSADGGFEASLGAAGSLARRPRSSDWWNLGWQRVDHRWSDERWDWAVSGVGQDIAELRATLTA